MPRIALVIEILRFETQNSHLKRRGDPNYSLSINKISVHKFANGYPFCSKTNPNVISSLLDGPLSAFPLRLLSMNL